MKLNKPFDQTGEFVNVIIDTPKNSRNKYTYDREADLYKLSGILPAGHSFPYDFGFVPGTLGGDGDPLDVLVLMEEPGFVGLWVECRLIGGYEAYQTERDGDRQRNDRLMAVSTDSLVYRGLKILADLDETLRDQIIHFFTSYNEIKGKKFEVAAMFDGDAAANVIKSSIVDG